MARLRLALLAAAALATAALALAGCANVPDRTVMDRPRTVDRANGQPRWMPCMIGDPLCH